ncbi:uncharacterized protein LOC116023804 [Ipomoea triloba]|uniref:uncharacterized protein LOC116023804 n=1 Tax=Ipomoea triloba TaxID=35885 RepID=UPI00125DA952|nr:uncharacterized protein LOC116023804 [Ipomoea triloba]
MANFCCSIETEPRTLNQGQLHLAREVAVDIVQNNQPQQASTIFIQGLKPTETVLVVPENNGVDKNKQEDSADVVTDKTIVQCLCSAEILESPDDQSKVKEPLTAPF